MNERDARDRRERRDLGMVKFRPVSRISHVPPVSPALTIPTATTESAPSHDPTQQRPYRGARLVPL